MIYTRGMAISEGSLCVYYWPRAMKMTIKATGYSEQIIKAVICANSWQKHHNTFFRSPTLRELLAYINDIHTNNVLRECKGLGLFEKVPKQKAYNVTNKGNDLNKVFNRFLSELMNNENVYRAGFDPSTHRKRPKGKLYNPQRSETIYKVRNRKKIDKGNVKA